MRFVLKAVGVIVVLALIAFGVALFTDFEAPRLGQRLIRIASESAGIELQAERVLLNLRRGLLLEGVEMRSEAEGEVLTATVDLLQVECSLLPLLRGEIVVERILSQSPRLEMVSREPGGASPATSGPADEAPSRPGEPDAGSESLEGRPKPVRIGELSILDAEFVSREEPGGSTTEIESLDFQLFDFVLEETAASAVIGVSGWGRLRADAVRLGTRGLVDLAAEVEADAGRYRLSGVEASGRSGDVRIERFEVDLTQDPYRYRVEASLREVDLDALLEEISAPGLGRASLELNGTGEGPGLEGAVADVEMGLDSGELPSVELLRSIDRIVGTSLDGARYEATEIRLSLVGDRLEVEPFEFVTSIARLGVGGTVELDGDIDLRTPVALPRESFTGPDGSSELLDRFTDSEGWLTIPLAVTGTVDAPRFGPDREAIAAATRRLAEEAKAAAETRIRSELAQLIGRRRPGSG